MNTFEINKELGSVSIFCGTFPRDLIPVIETRPAAVIVNTDASNEEGEHWIALLLLENNRGEYFDSFGLSPLTADVNNYMNEHCRGGWIFNTMPLQHPLSQSCGRY